MKILLYDQCDLEERESRHLKAWKAWHLVLYVFAAIFGIVNFVFLQNSMQLVNNNCILYTRELEFHMVMRPDAANDSNYAINDYSAPENDNLTETNAQATSDAVQNGENRAHDENAKTVKREVKENDENNATASTNVEGNATVITGNMTHRLMLDASRSLFEPDEDCQFPVFMPIMSTIFAILWVTMFTMCPGGGYSRTGLQQPWSILAPALLFALVMVGLTGHSFVVTNGGLHEFCAKFYVVTNSTTCSAVNPFLERGWNATWGMGGSAAATRAASAGVLASWVCGAALLLARCVAAPDFVVRHTEVYLTKDPQKKVIPHLKKIAKSRRLSQDSPNKRDNASLRSDPTITTELVSASVEPGQDSAPTSLMVTPIKTHRNADIIEMTYAPHERLEGLR